MTGLQGMGLPGMGMPAVGPGWSGSRGLGPEQGLRREEALERWWGEAAAAWLETKGAGSANTRRAYASAVEGFFESAGVRPWEVGGAQVIGWQQEMREAGLAESTVNLRLAAVSSFYEFCCYRFSVMDPATGREVVLAERNPVKRVERGKVSPYEKSTYLSAEEVRALLRSIRRDTVVGLRDYALVVAYLYTGRRSAEIRNLRWGEIRQEGGRWVYRWTGKGRKSRTDELPLPVYQAIAEYLAAAGRLEGMEEGDYVFVALDGEVAERLPRVREAVGREEAGPLSGSFVNRVVKKCARRAGLQWRSIHTHTLRHTAAMLRRELGADLQALQELLAHSSLAITQIYVQHTETRKDAMWAQVEALIGI